MPGESAAEELRATGTGGAADCAAAADAETGQELRILNGHTAGVAGVAFSPDGSALAVANTGWIIDLHDLKAPDAKPIELEGSSLFLDGRRIPFIDAREPGDADWSAHDVDIVVQATGKYRNSADLQKHLEAGAKKVIMASTPEPGQDIPLILRGINDELLTDSTNIVSLGSNTSNALAPILRVLDSSFGIEKAMFTTVHAMTNSQRLADVPTSVIATTRSQ